MRKQLTFAAILISAAAIGLEPTVAADGGGQCGGNLVGYKRILAGNTVIGELQLYYNGSNGNNCAVTMHGGPTWGVNLDTGVGLYVSDRQGNLLSNPAFERQGFRYQAGPVRTDGRSKCIVAGGGITYQGQRYNVWTQPHCK